MTRRLATSAAVGATLAALFFAGFLAVAVPAQRIAAAVLRRVEGNNTSSKGEIHHG